MLILCVSVVEGMSLDIATQAQNVSVLFIILTPAKSCANWANQTLLPYLLCNVTGDSKDNLRVLRSDYLNSSFFYIIPATSTLSMASGRDWSLLRKKGINFKASSL